MTRKSTELIHEGKYAAEVPVELIEDDIAWSPYLSPDDVKKLDAVRLALRRGDIAAAATAAARSSRRARRRTSCEWRGVTPGSF
jgi:hypothetical protein